MRFAEQFKHVGYMLEVLLANLFVLHTRSRVVVALRQPESSLVGFGDLGVGILEILI